MRLFDLLNAGRTTWLVVGSLQCALASVAAAAPSSTPIQHVIVIMQENRSFDNYFGAYPYKGRDGNYADGIPGGVCLPLSLTDSTQGCVAPYHDVHDGSFGGWHNAKDAAIDIDDGITSTKMDGFAARQQDAYVALCTSKPKSFVCLNPGSGLARHDVMGYHTDEELPNYWTYAQKFVLQDKLFEGVRDYTYPSHLELVSEWAASCKNYKDLTTCVTGLNYGYTAKETYPWVSMFQLLDLKAVTWKFYLAQGNEPDCDDQELTCDPVPQAGSIPGAFNPAAHFAYVQSQGAAYVAAHIPNVDQFLKDAKSGGTVTCNLPQASWVVPNADISEHPGNSGITAGQMYVTSLVNAVMQSACWQSTAIFISWDDWGGFYDHVVPPNVDFSKTATPVEGYGLRVPGLMVSAWARQGMIDHQLLSFDSYATFIENLFMGGARLDPVAMGQPDARPDVRDALTTAPFVDGTTAPIGDLMKEFDFTQTPLAPVVLNTHTPSNIQARCRKASTDFTHNCQLPVVTVSWNALTAVDPAGAFTHHLTRDGVDLPLCTGAATICKDTPPSGAHYYRVYTVDAQGTASSPSAAAEADEA
jgi:phospholipase C